MAKDDDAWLEQYVTEPMREAIEAGVSRSRFYREQLQGLGILSPATLKPIWEAAQRAYESYRDERPLSEVRPATDGLTAPAAMRIATDYLYTVVLTGAGGRQRTLSVATNDPSMTAADIVAQAMEVGNDRSRYERGSQIPPGGWSAGYIEAGWSR